MGRRIKSTHLDIWPAFTDAILAFLLVFVFLIAIQIVVNSLLNEEKVSMSEQLDDKNNLTNQQQVLIDTLRKQIDAEKAILAQITLGEKMRKEEQERITRLIQSLKKDYDDINIFSDGSTQTIRLGENSLFDTANATLKPSGKAIFIELVRLLTSHGEEIKTLQEIQVSGHTDNVPTNGRTFKTNWELSATRAVNVVKLLESEGVDPNRIKLTATGYGEYAPIDNNFTREGKARNRRVELRLVYTELITDRVRKR